MNIKILSKMLFPYVVVHSVWEPTLLLHMIITINFVDYYYHILMYICFLIICQEDHRIL